MPAIAPQLPVCDCECCADVPQVGRTFPLTECKRCRNSCANPDCHEPNGGRRVRVRQTRLEPLLGHMRVGHAPA